MKRFLKWWLIGAVALCVLVGCGGGGGGDDRGVVTDDALGNPVDPTDPFEADALARVLADTQGGLRGGDVRQRRFGELAQSAWRRTRALHMALRRGRVRGRDPFVSRRHRLPEARSAVVFQGIVFRHRRARHRLHAVALSEVHEPRKGGDRDEPMQAKRATRYFALWLPKREHEKRGQAPDLVLAWAITRRTATQDARPSRYRGYGLAEAARRAGRDGRREATVLFVKGALYVFTHFLPLSAANVDDF